MFPAIISSLCSFFSNKILFTYFVGLGAQKSEDNLGESILSFQHVCPRDRTRVTNFSGKHLTQRSHLPVPTSLVLQFQEIQKFLASVKRKNRKVSFDFYSMLETS